MRRDRGWIAIVVMAIAVLALPSLREATDFPVFYMVFLYSVMFWVAQATSWNLLSGFSGYFSFGQGAFYGVGVYAMAVLFARRGMPWTVGLLAGGLAGMVLALAVGTVAFRLRSLRGEIFALLTLALPFILAAVARLTDAIDGGQGVILPVPDLPAFLSSFQDFVFVIGGLIAVLALAVSYTMSRTRFGWALFAIHDDEDVAEALGVPTFRHKMVAIGANGLIAGLSGALSALQVGFVTPEGTFNLRVPLMVIVMAVLGGRRHWAGPMVGALYVVVLQNRLSAGALEGWSLIILGVVLIVIVLLAPEGLMARFVRRPWVVTGSLLGTLAVLALWRGWGEPVTWLAAALAVAAVIAFLPAKKASSSEVRHTPASHTDDDSLEALPVGDRVLVEARDVRKHFGGLKAVDGVTITVSEGEILGLVGPNGSGKTTMVNLVSSALPPTSGSVLVGGVDTGSMSPHRVAHLGVARTYQIPRPFASMSVRDNVAMAIMFGTEPRGLDAAREAADEYLEQVGLSDLADALPDGVNLHERQLLEMARAVATRPKVLMLDEALAGLNPVEIDNAVAVVRRIHRSGVAIILVEHLLRVVNQLATRIVVLEQGRELASGLPADVMSDPAVVSAYLGREHGAAGN